MNKVRQLTEEQEKRAISIHNNSLIILMHDHIPIASDIPKMKSGGVTAKVYNLICDVGISLIFNQVSTNTMDGQKMP